MIVSAQWTGPKRTGVVIEIADADVDLRSPGGREVRLRLRLSPSDVADLLAALGRLARDGAGDDVHEQDGE